MLHERGSIPFAPSMLPVHKFYNVRKYSYKRLSYLIALVPIATHRKNILEYYIPLSLTICVSFMVIMKFWICSTCVRVKDI